MKRLVRTTKATKATLLFSVLISNVLALIMPLVARQVLSRSGEAANISTVIVLVTIVVLAALFESVIRFCRTIILAQHDRQFMTEKLHWLLDRVARAKRLKFRSAAAASLDYSSALQQVKGIASGELSLVWAELAFVPLLLALLFVLSPACGIAVVLFVAGLVIYTVRATRQFSTIAETSREAGERRFERLFSILERMLLVKSFAVEHHMTRVYEQAHGAAMRNNLRLAMSATRLTHAGAVSGMMLNVMLLLTCATVAAYDHMDVAVVISAVLLSSRLMDPIQRAVFVFVQGRDRFAAFRKIVDLEAMTQTDSASLPDGSFSEFQSLQVTGLSLYSARQRPISLSVKPGEFIAISGHDVAATKRLMRSLAGLEIMEGGVGGHVRVNDIAIENYGMADRNRILGYVSDNSRLFDGSIQDNITRFGEVSVEQAFEVARLFGIDQRLDELPGGLQTKVGDGVGGNVPPGLERQIAILRAVVHRPRLILFDHAEQGLDRESYAELIRFFGLVRGNATVVIASEDANLTSLADRTYRLDEGGLSLNSDVIAQDVSYRALVL